MTNKLTTEDAEDTEVFEYRKTMFASVSSVSSVVNSFWSTDED